MAFRMNRPVIKGSALHKASIAKAKGASIVAPAEQGADAVLVNRSRDLGLSNVGHAIDFSKEKRELDIRRKKKKKDEDPETPETTDTKETTGFVGKYLPETKISDVKLGFTGISDHDKIMAIPSKVEKTTGPEDGDVSKSGNIWDGEGGRWLDPSIYKEMQKESSAVKMRSDKIWSGAVEGGEVRRKMRKGGYTPN